MLDTPHQVVSEDTDVNEVIMKFSLMKTHTYQLGNTHIYIYAHVEHFWLHAWYKVGLNKFSGIVLVTIQFPDHDAIKLEIINKKIEKPYTLKN